jgi:hypothetical protein
MKSEGSFENVPNVPNEANTNKSITAKPVSCFPVFFGGFDILKQILLHAVVFLHKNNVFNIVIINYINLKKTSLQLLQKLSES